MSRGFLGALAGIGLTILAWYGPWLWPGWPATTVLDFVLGRWAPSEVSFPVKAVGMVVLIVINVGFWGLVTAAALWTFDRRRTLS